MGSPDARGAGPVDWAAVRLVVFDVDGTLYDQRRLRLAMAADLLLDAARRRDLTAVRVLSAYRRLRETMGEEDIDGFEAELRGRTARATGIARDAVDAVVAEWIDRRPLPRLLACRCEGIDRLFAGLVRKGRTIGILSDYPAREKLAALGLSADHVVTAGDAGVDRLKPHPRGLQAVMAAARTTPGETVLVGDRADRDGAVAVRCGVRALIRSRRPVPGFTTFSRYDDPLFGPLL